MGEKDEEVKTAAPDNDPSEEANEPIRSSDDLEEKKRTVHGLNAEGNFANTQIFIQSMNLTSPPGQVSQPENGQAYSLQVTKDCAAFVERYKNSEYLAVAILLSIFEVVRLSDLPDLMGPLLECLPAAPPEGGGAAAQFGDPYISMDKLLTTVGGKCLIAEDGQKYVSLGESSQQALQNLWTQFSALRSAISKWLIQTYKGSKYRTAFDTYQIVTAFARVISLDFADAKERIFPRLCSDPDNALLLGHILCKLYGDVHLRQKVDDILLEWFRSSGSWLWRPACLACAFLQSALNIDLFEPWIERTIKKRLIYMTKQDSSFAAVLLLRSQYFRTKFSTFLGDAVREAATRADRLSKAQIYLYLLRYCYYLIDSNQQDLPLVVCDNKAQLISLGPLLSQLMSLYALRQQLFWILRAYMKEISHYYYSKELLDHLAAYFYTLMQYAPDYRRDVLQFLDGLDNSLADRLQELLGCVCPEIAV